MAAAARRRWYALAGGVVALVVAAAVVLVMTNREEPPDLMGEIFTDPSYPAVERAADLVSRMTLAEKAGQMVSSQAPAIPRLGVRAYSWWNEAVHGVAREGTLDGENPPDLVNTTSYPVSLSLGSTWNPQLVHDVASAISDEAREVVRDNTLDLNFYSPTVNLARDPRWGRNDETYSEDPYLTSAIAAQYVNGMEGKGPDGQLLPEGGGYLKTTTTLKHYAANNSEFNRRTGSSDMDERTLREYYTAQFRAIIRAADPASIMTAYNEVNGVPASANVHLLETLGRETFGFTGFYTSDCDAIYEMQAGHAWTPPGHDGAVDEVSRHAYANAAGVDLDCQLGYHDQANYANELPAAVAQRVETELGTFTEANLDASLVRLFTARFELGEFDDPATVPWVTAARSRVPPGTWVNSDANGAVTETPARLELARRAATEALVLLRNDSARLPLRVPASGGYRIAVLGPLADPPLLYLGGYSSTQVRAGAANNVSPYRGIAAAARAINPGATVDLVDESADLESYDAVVVCLGTDSLAAGEDTDRATLALPGQQADLAARVAARNPATVAYLATVGQVDLGALHDVPALLWSSYNGQRQGEALADVLFGQMNPSGRLPFTWYADGAALPDIGDYGIRPTAFSPGRTYQYFTGAVAYPFGHGGSYTTFAYSPARVDVADAVDAMADDTVTVTVDVTNAGPVAGAEVVQVYAATPDSPASALRPVRRLVGFRKIALQPGETTTVAVPVRLADLAFFDQAQGRFVVDQGRYRFEVGSSSVDIRATATVSVSGALTPVPAVLTARPATDAASAAPQVIFGVGEQILPRLTMAMNDDTLYAQTAFPDGTTISFNSDRPAVVSADTSGAIRTVSTGVATVTATVTYHDTSVATQFVVVVR